jgi:hypothetical protein
MMSHIFARPRLFWPCLVAVWLLWELGSAGRCAAADADDEDLADQVPQAQRGFMVSDDTFDQWLFGNARNASGGRKCIESRLELQLEELDRSCGLSEAQKRKLELAARGDIGRFFERVEQSRKKFLAKQDQNAINQIWQDIQPLQAKLQAGLFGENSLYQKLLSRTLTPEQSVKVAQVDKERRAFRYNATVALVVVTLENSVPLREEQRQKLTTLIRERTQPPRKFGQYDHQLVLCQLARLPEGELKPIFDEVQWRALNRQLTQAKGMEQFLIANGELSPAGEPGASQPQRLEEAKE